MTMSGAPFEVDPVTTELVARWVDEQLIDRMGDRKAHV